MQVWHLTYDEREEFRKVKFDKKIFNSVMQHTVGKTFAKIFMLPKTQIS